MSCYGAGDRKFHGPAMHPSGMAVGILFQWAALETEEGTPPLLEPWQDSAVPPAPCFLSTDTKGGRLTWKRKGAGTQVTASQPRAPGLSGKGRGRNKFSHSQAGAQNHYMEEEEVSAVPVPTLFWKQNSFPSWPGTRVCSACFLSLAGLPSWHSFSLGYSFLSQALSFLEPEQTVLPFIPSLQHSFYPPETPLSRAHTI